MLRKFINSNKKFYLILLLIGIVSLIYVIESSNINEESKPVFNLLNKDNVVREDLNGDNKKDTIVIKNTGEGFMGQINLNKDETYSLNCHKSLPSLGEYSDYWPIRISTIDISRNNSKDIIIQSSFHNKPIQHIFSWNGTSYEDIFCSYNNIMGFLDSCNNKTPKLISGNFLGGNLDLKSYMWKENSIKEINDSSNFNIPAMDTLCNFISLLESFPNAYLSVPNYIYPQISGNDLETLFKLANSTNFYKFQDGYFTDLAWDESGVVTCENWILNFRAINTTDNTKVKNLTINLMINKYTDTDFPYKITSINAY